MQKKIIFTLVASLIFGSAGGALSSYWMMTNLTGESMDSMDSTYVEESLMIEAQQKVEPSVVSIVEYIALEEFRQLYLGVGQGNREGNPLPTAFYDPDRDGLAELGGGTGFIIDPSGIVLTNKHVVETEGQYVGITNEGVEFDLEVMALDPGNDVAIAQLVARDDSPGEELIGNLPYAELGDSDLLVPGQQVLAMGFALAEYEHTTTAGIISATGRQIVASDSFGDTETLFDLLQTDAAINPGNSGGPLINLAGEVIGINTAVDSTAQGIGFSIPINDVKPAIESWQKYGEIVRPVIGVRYLMLTPSMARDLRLEVVSGALIVGNPRTGELSVIPGSPAEQAGLQPHDVVMAVDGESITMDYTLQDAILRRQIGEEVTLTIWRDGAELDVMVELTKEETSV